jgi:hypothetical protein
MNKCIECAPYKRDSPVHEGTTCIDVATSYWDHRSDVYTCRYDKGSLSTVESRLKAFLRIDIFRTFYYFMVMIIVR